MALLNKEKALFQNYGNSLENCRRCVVSRQEIKTVQNMTFAIILRPPQYKVSKNLARDTFVRPCSRKDSSWIEKFVQKLLNLTFQHDNADLAFKQYIYKIIQIEIFISSGFETFPELLRQSHSCWSSKMRKIWSKKGKARFHWWSRIQ